MSHRKLWKPELTKFCWSFSKLMMKISHSKNWLILNGLSFSLMTIKLINIHFHFIIRRLVTVQSQGQSMWGYKIWVERRKLKLSAINKIAQKWDKKAGVDLIQWDTLRYFVCFTVGEMRKLCCSISSKCFFNKIILIFPLYRKCEIIIKKDGFEAK